MPDGSRLPEEEMHMATVTYDKATRIYPKAVKPSVDKLDLEIADGEFLVLVGPSGSGKSTALRMLAARIFQHLAGRVEWRVPVCEKLGIKILFAGK